MLTLISKKFENKEAIQFKYAIDLALKGEVMAYATSKGTVMIISEEKLKELINKKDAS